MNNLSNESFLSKRSNFSILQVKGEQAEEFLQGQFTSDIKAMQDLQIQFSAYLNRKGRVVSTFYLIKKSSNCFLMLLPASNLENTLTPLKKFGAFSKIVFTDVTKQYDIICSYGLKHALITEVLNINANTKNNFMSQASEFMYLNIHTNAYAAWLICNKNSSEQIYKKLLNLDIDESSASLQDILLGVPFIYSETSEKHLAHSINLPELGAVAFNKGCFLGQEIVARMQNLGKPKQGLYTVEFADATKQDLNIGAAILNNEQQQSGEIILAAPNKQKTLALASLYHSKTGGQEFKILSKNI